MELSQIVTLCEKRLIKLNNNLKNDRVLFKKYDDTFAEQKKHELLRALKVQALWETATI